MRNKVEFNSKTAVITGAASGLGAGIAQKLVVLGARVALIDIDKMRLEEFVNKNADHKEGILSLTCDVTNAEKVRGCFERIHNHFGSIDFLFSNAGIGGTLPFKDANNEQWDKIIDLNIKGVINGISTVYPLMKKQQSGYILNTSSIAGIIPFRGQSLYNTTKYAITGLTLSLVKEFEADNINLSVICPGNVKTRIFYKPIVGEEAREEEVRIPWDAISVDRAVKDIFEGLRKRKPVIITPKWLKIYYWLYKLTGRLPR